MYKAEAYRTEKKLKNFPEKEVTCSSTIWIVLMFTIPLSCLRLHVEYVKNKELCLYLLVPIMIGLHVLFLYLCKSVKVEKNKITVKCLLGLHVKTFLKKNIISIQEEEAGRGFKYLVIRNSNGQVCKIHPFAVRHYEGLLTKLGGWLDK